MKLYCFFLPRNYKNGKPVEEEKFDIFTEKLNKKFKGVTFIPSIDFPLIQGTWTNPKTKEVSKDKIAKIELFVEDTMKIQTWIKNFKTYLEKELGQDEIFVLVQNAEIL